MDRVRQIQRQSEHHLRSGRTGIEEAPQTPLIHVSNLNYEITEGDLLAIFCQYGHINPTDVHLVRDKETGKSCGWAWLKYRDERSTILAVDNLNGIEVAGRVLRVDYCTNIRVDERNLDRFEEEQKLINQAFEEFQQQDQERQRRDTPSASSRSEEDEMLKRARRKRQRETETRQGTKDDDDDEQDPMAEYFRRRKHKKSKHRKHRHHRSRSPRE